MKSDAVQSLVEKLNPNDRARLERLVRIESIKRAAVRKDILTWGQLLFPDKFPLPFCSELHGYFVDIRREPLTDTEAPRNHAKTTIKCFLIPIFQALNEPTEFRHYLNVQATGAKADSINRAIRSELESNEELIEIYGYQIGNRWTDGQFVLRNGVVFTAIGAGQSIRGLNYNNVRPDYIIVDDLYDEEDINNPDSTLKKNDWFWSSLYPARAKSKKCSIHVQGTAINDEDLLKKLSKQDRWVYRTFRAITDWDKKSVLWPELNTFDSLEKDREDMGSVIFFRELQNERRDESTAIVKKKWIKFYKPEDLKFDNHFFISNVYLGVDPSIGKKVENDATGMALVLECTYEDGKGTFYYIEQVWNEHLSLDARVRLLQEIADSRPEEREVTSCKIESIAGFKDFTAEVIRRSNLPVVEVDQVKDKISNLESKSHFFENGKVFINEFIEPKLRDQLIYQLTTNHPKHDDIRDAVLLCLDPEAESNWNFV